MKVSASKFLTVQYAKKENFCFVLSFMLQALC